MRTRPAGVWVRVMRPDASPGASRPAPPRTSLPLALLAAVVGLAVLHGCEDVQVTAVEVASVTVSPSQLTLLPGELAQLTATPRDASGNPLADRPVSWSSDDTSLATVTSSGMVEGLTPGQTVIRASAGDAQSTATVTVGAPPRIGLSRTQVALRGVASGDVTQPEEVAITNDGAGTLSGLTATVSYPSGQPQGWLDASLGGSQAPATLTLQASPAQLAEGTYLAQVEVASEAAGNSPRVVEVELEVDAAPARIALSTSSVGFVWEEGQSPPSPRQVGLTNEGGGSLSGLALSVAYVEGGATGWLSAELDDTSAPTQISLDVDPESLETGVYDAAVEVSSPAAANSPQELRVRLTVGDPPPEIEVVPDTVHWATTEGNSPSDQSVQVQNQGSGELGDLAASVSYAGGEPTGWLSAQLQAPTAPTTLQLSVQASDLPPGTYSATVQISSPDAVNSPQTVAATLQVDPGQSEIDADPEVLPADGEAISTITVRLRSDLMPTGDPDVQLSTTRGSLSSVADQGGGTYAATLTAPTSVGEGVVTGTVDGSAIPDSAVVSFVPGEASPATSTITANPGSLPADGQSTSTITVQLRDAHGNALTEGGREVTLALEGEGTLGEVTDRDNGTYTATYTAGAEVGSAVITGRLHGQSMDDQAVVALGSSDVSPETSRVEADPDTLAADGEAASTVTIRLMDANENPIGGLVDGDFDVELTDGQGGGTDASRSTVTETTTAGTYTFDVTNTTAEEVTVIVTARGTTLNARPTIQFVADDAETTLTLVSGDGQAGTVGEELDDPLVVQVTDGQGNPMSGVTVTWAPGDNGSADPTSSTTGTNGEASTIWTLGSEPGEQTLTASAEGVDGSVTFTADAEAGGISASTSDVIADPDTDVTADGSTASEVTVELRDSEDNSIGGLGNNDFDIALTDDDGGSTDAAHSEVTETTTAGTYTFDVTNTSAEEVTVVVTARGTTLDAQPTIQFVAGEPTSLAIESGDGQKGMSDEELDDPLVVEVTDGQGNPVSGVTVTWDPGDDGSADPPNSTTGTNGRTSTNWTLGDEVGEQTLTASAEGVDDPVTFTADAQAGTISASTSDVIADPDTDVTADGSTASEVTVELRDSEDNPIGGLGNNDFDIALTDDDGASTDAAHSEVTETTTAGTYTFDVTNTSAEEVTVVVTARGTTIDAQPTIQFVAGEPTYLAIQSGDGQSGPAGETLDSLLVVEVTDGQDNPVSGITVTWDPGDDGSADPTSSTTGTNGRTSTTWTLGYEMGEQTLIASAERVDDPVTFTATADTARISASESSVEAEPDSDVVANGGDASTVTVDLRNPEDNPVGGLPPGHFKVTLTVNGTESTTAKRTRVRETSTAGTYTFEVTNTTAEEVTVTVTARDTTLDEQPTIEFVAEGQQ